MCPRRRIRQVAAVTRRILLSTSGKLREWLSNGSFLNIFSRPVNKSSLAVFTTNIMAPVSSEVMLAFWLLPSWFRSWGPARWLESSGKPGQLPGEVARMARVLGSQDGCQVKWPEWPKSSGKPGRLPGEVARMAIGQSGQWLEWLLSTLPSCYRPLVSRSGLPVPLVPTIWTLHYGF